MDRQTEASHVADRSRATIRIRRLDALFRAQRAREVIDRESEVAERAIGTPGRATGSATAADTDAERLVAIHQSLRHERRVARRPFHHRSERLVLALELAERLALERLGFADYAAFEASGGGEAPEPDVIDLARIERAQHELAEAEADLAEINGRRDRSWPTSPRRTDRRRSLFDVPRDLGSDTLANVLPIRPGVRPDRPDRRSSRGSSDDAGAVEDAGDDTTVGAVLGEIVHDGRRIRIERIPGLAYDADDGSSRLGPNSISYGDPSPEPDPT